MTKARSIALLGLALSGCVQLLAVEEFRVEGSTTATGGGLGGSPSPGCTKDAECVAEGGPCEVARCDAGVCATTLAAPGTPCGDGARCDDTGACRLDLGKPCGSPGACASGHCVEGVCCSSECGPCASCTTTLAPGICLPLAAGTLAPGGACDAAATSNPARCDGLGRCAGGKLAKVALAGFASGADRGLALARRPDASWILAGARFATPTSLIGTGDWHLVAFDSDPTALALATYAGTQDDTAKAVATDAAGNDFVVGTTSQGFAVTGQPLQANAGLSDTVIVKRDPKGKVLWAQAVHASPAIDTANDVTVDLAGDAIVVGSTGAEGRIAKFLGSTGARSPDVAVTSDQNSVVLSSVAVFPGGDLLVVGTLRGSAYFHGTKLTNPVPGWSGEDVLVLRLDATASQLRWFRILGGSQNDVGVQGAVAPDGKVAVVGTFASSLSIDANVTLGGADPSEAFLVVFNGVSGATEWATPLVGAGDTSAGGVAFDGAGNVVVVGTFGSSTQPTVKLFGKEFIGNFGSSDAFAFKATAGGTPLWYRTFGGAGYDAFARVVVTPDGLVVAGTTQGFAADGMQVPPSAQEDAALFVLTP